MIIPSVRISMPPDCFVAEMCIRDRLNILGLLDNPTSGKYFLGNHEVANLKEKERTDVRKGEKMCIRDSYSKMPPY